jgi:hypothetical protein
MHSKMQNDKTCSEIVSALVRTRTEANMLLTELDLLLRSLYIIGPGDFESTLESGIRAKTAYAITQTTNKENREEILNKTKEIVNSLNYMGLTVAFDPNLEIIGKINTWIKQNLGEGIALDITINKSILGGAIIEYKGKVGSFTVLSKVEDYFNQQSC